MNEEHLSNIILKNGYPLFRFKQAKRNVFARLIESWDAATDLPEDLRALLTREVPIESISVQRLLESENKDTLKALFATSDGLFIEAVLMRHDRGRRTVCVSSQVGCPMKCSFCATGKLGFKRNLTAEEIVDQVLFFSRLLNKKREPRSRRFATLRGERVTNVVYMGMGEPMNNYDNVMASIRALNDKNGLNLGARHISISTCGIVPGIKKLTKEKLQVNLAISLHAASDETRSRLMPVNAAYPLARLMKAVAEYAVATRRKVMFEYILISGINDSDEHARSLAALIGRNKLYHINLIKYHKAQAKSVTLPGAIGATPEYRAPTRERVNRFFNILKKSGVSCTFRISFGEDIAGACGQLAP